MSFAGWAAVIVTSQAAKYQVHQGEKAKKTAKHAKERTKGRARELADAANQDDVNAKASALTGRRKRAAGAARNLNLFGGSMSDAATRAKKSLTGQ